MIPIEGNRSVNEYKTNIITLNQQGHSEVIQSTMLA